MEFSNEFIPSFAENNQFEQFKQIYFSREIPEENKPFIEAAKQEVSPIFEPTRDPRVNFIDSHFFENPSHFKGREKKQGLKESFELNDLGQLIRNIISHSDVYDFGCGRINDPEFEFHNRKAVDLGSRRLLEFIQEYGGKRYIGIDIDIDEEYIKEGELEEFFIKGDILEMLSQMPSKDNKAEGENNKLLIFSGLEMRNMSYEGFNGYLMFMKYLNGEECWFTEKMKEIEDQVGKEKVKEFILYAEELKKKKIEMEKNNKNIKEKRKLAEGFYNDFDDALDDLFVNVNKKYHSLKDRFNDYYSVHIYSDSKKLEDIQIHIDYLQKMAEEIERITDIGDTILIGPSSFSIDLHVIPDLSNAGFEEVDSTNLFSLYERKFISIK